MMHIRQGNTEDIYALSQLEMISYPEAEGASARCIKGRLEHYANHFWILESQTDGILAFVNGLVTNQPDLTDEMYDKPDMHDENGCWQMIFSVVTAPEHRRKGYAGQLLQHVIADAKKQHRRGLVLTCKKRLIPFYAAFGFADEGLSASVHGNVSWNQMRLTFSKSEKSQIHKKEDGQH